jgi:hypothetical protein
MLSTEVASTNGTYENTAILFRTSKTALDPPEEATTVCQSATTYMLISYYRGKLRPADIAHLLRQIEEGRGNLLDGLLAGALSAHVQAEVDNQLT